VIDFYNFCSVEESYTTDLRSRLFTYVSRLHWGEWEKLHLEFFSKSVYSIWTKFSKSTVLVAFEILLDFRD